MLGVRFPHETLIGSQILEIPLEPLLVRLMAIMFLIFCSRNEQAVTRFGGKLMVNIRNFHPNMKVSELKGGLLDFWSAWADGLEPSVEPSPNGEDIVVYVRRGDGWELYRAGEGAHARIATRFGNEIAEWIE